MENHIIEQRIIFNYSTLSNKIHFFSTFPFNICNVLIRFGLILSIINYII